MIRSVEIWNLRYFKHLALDQLKRLTLIVTADNFGKTSVLEGMVLLIGSNRWFMPTWDSTPRCPFP